MSNPFLISNFRGMVLIRNFLSTFENPLISSLYKNIRRRQNFMAFRKNIQFGRILKFRFSAKAHFLRQQHCSPQSKRAATLSPLIDRKKCVETRPYEMLRCWNDTAGKSFYSWVHLRLRRMRGGTHLSRTLTPREQDSRRGDT